ncbi:MAG: hypothetical protein K8T20_05125 [Planctomycetes bacterium]|nr:hypothetical protein [Planctomycetota bacterium]
MAPVIPARLFQTWRDAKNLPPRMREATERLRSNNAGLEHQVFGDADCRDYLDAHFGTEVRQAFDDLVPGAYKADLWRYCVLYREGGIYLDIKFVEVGEFRVSSLLGRERFVLERKVNLWRPGSWGLYNALLVCLPGNEVLKTCIGRIVEGVKLRAYMSSPMHLTGPGLLGEVHFGIQNTPEELSRKVQPFDLCYAQEGGAVLRDRARVLREYPEYRRELKDFAVTEHYWDLWHSRRIYKHSPV